MPNTLAHFGVQGAITHLAAPRTDPKVIFLGCLLPDIPWIVQRLVGLVIPTADPYTLRLYCIAQASFAVTLCLCAALATLSTSPLNVFAVLGANSLVHLVLDALQIKWANGVHILAPFSWELWNVGIFWPESLPTYALTALGLGYVVWRWHDAIIRPIPGPTRSPMARWLALGWLTMYVLLPVIWLSGPAQTDSHFVETLRAPKAHRIGHYVEFDRNRYVKQPHGDILRTFAGERLRVENAILDHSATVSVRARFVAPDTIHVLAFHEHTMFRDAGSYAGIALLGTMWLMAWGKTTRRKGRA